MTRLKAINRLLELAQASGCDPESAHSEADDILCKLLLALGYHDVVEAWGKVRKWYA